MALSPMCNNAAARAALDALLARLNVGGAPGTLELRTGPVEASCEAPDGGTLIATLTLSATAFAPSVDNGAGGATATANPITGANAVAQGTIQHFRAKDSTGAVVLQDTAGVGATALQLDNSTVDVGAPISVTAWTVTLPDGSGTD